MINLRLPSKPLFGLAAFCLVLSCGCQSMRDMNMGLMTMDRRTFGETPGGEEISVITLENANGMKAKVTTYGAILTELWVPDARGNLTNVVHGFDDAEEYLQGHPAFGSTIGRYANRIGNARFPLDGEWVEVTRNSGSHHIHGGLEGFHKKLWTLKSQGVTDDSVSVELSYFSEDEEEGYPGNLNVTVKYTLTLDNALRIDYTAATDEPTVVNLTNHSYFNLSGHGDVLGHILMINASQYTPADSQLIPTGEIAPVEGTPLDFTEPAAIGERIEELYPRPGGYDHNYIIEGEPGTLRLAARVREPQSGRVMECYTTEPGVQLYTGNFLNGQRTGVGGVVYGKHSGFCLETQHYPDSPNKPNFPSTVLRPNETFQSSTVYQFKN